MFEDRDILSPAPARPDAAAAKAAGMASSALSDGNALPDEGAPPAGDLSPAVEPPAAPARPNPPAAYGGPPPAAYGEPGPAGPARWTPVWIIRHMPRPIIAGLLTGVIMYTFMKCLSEGHYFLADYMFVLVGAAVFMAGAIQRLNWRHALLMCIPLGMTVGMACLDAYSALPWTDTWQGELLQGTLIILLLGLGELTLTRQLTRRSAAVLTMLGAAFSAGLIAGRRAIQMWLMEDFSAYWTWATVVVVLQSMIIWVPAVVSPPLSRTRAWPVAFAIGILTVAAYVHLHMNGAFR